MTITETNKLWLDRAADQFKVKPEALLNGILDLLRQRDQDQSQGQKLADWIAAAGQAHTMTGEQMERLQKAVEESEAAVKATQIYLTLIQTNQTKSTQTP